MPIEQVVQLLEELIKVIKAKVPENYENENRDVYFYCMGKNDGIGMVVSTLESCVKGILKLTAEE